jgi:hypothetical protein
MHVARQTIELCDHDRTALAARLIECSGKLWATVQGISALACLDLGEHADDLESFRCGKPFDSLSLRVDTKARTALLRRRNTKVSDDWPRHDGLLGAFSLSSALDRKSDQSGVNPPADRAGAIYSGSAAGTNNGNSSSDKSAARRTASL